MSLYFEKPPHGVALLLQTTIWRDLVSRGVFFYMPRMGPCFRRSPGVCTFMFRKTASSSIFMLVVFSEKRGQVTLDIFNVSSCYPDYLSESVVSL